MRVIIDGKGQAVDGDDTTTGAVCIATGDGYICDGRIVLRVGDKTTACPLCAEPGTVAEGAPCFISDGSEVAVDGSLVQCACPPGTNRVVAPPDCPTLAGDKVFARGRPRRAELWSACALR